MSKLQHTPGPWKIGNINNDSGTIICLDEKKPITTTIAFLAFQDNINQLQANACLIATAPEMLETLLYTWKWHCGAFQASLKKRYQEIIERATGRNIEEIL